MTKLCWLNKALIAKVGEEKGLQQQAILHKSDLLESKFKAGFKAVFGIDIVVWNPMAMMVMK
jgi:hypothetical protein